MTGCSAICNCDHARPTDCQCSFPAHHHKGDYHFKKPVKESDQAKDRFDIND